MSEATLTIEKAVGEAAWDPSSQHQVEVNETLGMHPTRPTGRVGAITLHELGVDPEGRSGFALRALRVDLPEQRPFGGQNTEFVFAQDDMDAFVGGYDAEDGIWCGLDAQREPLAFATWVRAMLDRRGFNVRDFGDFHVHARSKDVGEGYVSWVYQISLRGMAPTEMLWQTMWHYEPHPDGTVCRALTIEHISIDDEADVLDGLDVSEPWIQEAFALDGLDYEDPEHVDHAEARDGLEHAFADDVWDAHARDDLDYEDESAAFEAYALEGLEADDEDDVWGAIARDGLDYIDFDALDAAMGDEDEDEEELSF